PARAARPESLTGRDGDAVLCEQTLRSEPVGKPKPHEERALADDRAGQSAGDDVAAPFVRRDTFGDGLLRAGQGCDGSALQRLEDADAAVVVQQVDPFDDLRVPDDEA